MDKTILHADDCLEESLGWLETARCDLEELRRVSGGKWSSFLEALALIEIARGALEKIRAVLAQDVVQAKRDEDEADSAG